MTTTDRWPVRVWPGIAIVAMVAFLMLVPAWVAPRTMLHFISFFTGPMLGLLLGVVWWTTYSRTHGTIKWGVLALILLPLVGLSSLEIAETGIPFGTLFFGAPFVILVMVIWLVASFPMPRSVRQYGTFAWLAAAWVAVGLLRVDGTDGDMLPEYSFRFSSKPEDRDAEELKNRALVAPAKPLSESAKDSLDWAEFRGPNRDGVVGGTGIDPDWETNPPKQLWKQKIGPGWGTFAVVGDRLFTQEQRQNDEAVVCYDAATGGPIWRHYETAKFSDLNAGAGPRATPTVVAGKLYAMGATGLLLCLNAEDGQLIWKTDITKDTGGAPPQWGYSSSPLVIGALVIVYAGGPGGQGTAAFDAATGQYRWGSGSATHGYSSAQRAVIDGVEQILMLSDYGLESFEPKKGLLLWEYKWFVKGMNRVTQPTVVGAGGFLLGTGIGGEMGTRRIFVLKDSLDWKVDIVWSSDKLRPYFNDGVVHDGHLYGFDDKKLVCADLKDGSIKWDVGTKYGHGQILLLKDQGLLVIQAVDGKVHLVKASPVEPTELGKLTGISGKTWNHPVVNRGKLYIRNGAWAAAYELKSK